MSRFSYPSLSSDAIRAMRDTRFTGGEIDGTVFNRCGTKLAAGEASRLAAHIREVTGLGPDDVCAAHNPEFAEHDYLRISKGTGLYGMICEMKS